MALIGLEDKFPFLDEVELKELKNKKKNATILKTIKFNEDERILLKYITYLDKNFSTYVKQLIEKDMLDSLGKNNSDSNINDEYIINLIEKVLEKKSNKTEIDNKSDVKIKSKEKKELLNDLGALNIRPR